MMNINLFINVRLKIRYLYNTNYILSSGPHSTIPTKKKTTYYKL